MDNDSFVILLVDDEEDILDFVGYNLRKEGYTVHTATNGRDAISLALKINPHLILLDVMMPEMDGVETCRELKRTKALDETIIVFFTARSEDFTQILSLDAGGDDYITKPIKPALLVSKVNSLLRRHKVVKQVSKVYQAGDLIIDKEKYLVFKDGREIQLARKEFELLNLLASRPDRVYTRDEILNQVWDDDVVVGERTIDVHIRKIREKTGSDHIRTLKGVGYKFVK
ncbi:MAG TPA: response regulator transcription factor [Bacteroidales bacterium]|nr:response regulator transcription factor [Bacteroidales bacterium]